MKFLVAFLAILAVASCQSFVYNVGNECNSYSCPTSNWYYNQTYNQLGCPQSGNKLSQFRLVNNSYVIDLFSNSSKVTVPLTYNTQAYTNGLQYYSAINNGYYAILNCTYPSAKNFTTLCNKHQLVGGKLLNNTFQAACAYGLDYNSTFYLQSNLE